MSKRCPECHRINDDSRKFCSYCGATLDPHLRLIQDLEKQRETEPSKQRERTKDEMSFNVTRTQQEEKKGSALPWILLGLAVIAVAAWFFLKL